MATATPDKSAILMPEDAEQRFRRLYLEHYRRIAGYALRRGNDPSDAADIVAETFLVAWRRLSDVPEGRETLLWLYSVTRNVHANSRRSAKRQQEILRRLQFEVHAKPTEIAFPSDEGAIRTALNRLRRQDREILCLSGWEGLGPHEIGMVLNCSPGTAKVRLFRARRRLEQELARLGIDGPSVGERQSRVTGVLGEQRKDGAHGG